MDLITPLLVGLCAGTPALYTKACQTSIEGVYIQSGWHDKAKTVQSTIASNGLSKEKELFGNKTAIVNTVVLAGLAIKNKKANITLPNFGLKARFSTDLEHNSIGFRLAWSW